MKAGLALSIMGAYLAVVIVGSVVAIEQHKIHSEFRDLRDMILTRLPLVEDGPATVRRTVAPPYPPPYPVGTPTPTRTRVAPTATPMTHTATATSTPKVCGPTEPQPTPEWCDDPN